VAGIKASCLAVREAKHLSRDNKFDQGPRTITPNLGANAACCKY
jgi:hypothetical protein